jgi:hypothetical protein
MNKTDSSKVGGVEGKLPALPRARRVTRFRFRHLLVALGLAACGGAATTRVAGGESHFLLQCDEDCPGGLECIAGVCTRACVVGQSQCSDLAPDAVCTNQSIEPGAVAVCDVDCERDRDCAALGSGFSCETGFCRGPAPPARPDGGGGTGATAGAAGTGGKAGAGVGGSSTGGEPPTITPFSPRCEQPLGFTSECSFEATCEQLGCGDGTSPFDARGCSRRCRTSADCAAGERCRDTLLVISEEECPALGSEIEACSLEGGSCSCSSTADCEHPAVCVDAEAYPQELDCAVADASCQALAYSEFELQNLLALAEFETPEAAVPFAECLDSVLRQRVKLECDAPAFKPVCAEPFDFTFTSECSFEDTCKELGCGDGFSQFDAQGCSRFCESSADCGNGQRCRHVELVLREDECPSSGSEASCSIQNGKCSCGFTADCPLPNICVDAAQYPITLDCVLDGATCEQLANAASGWQTFLQGGTGTAADNEGANGCLSKVQAQRVSLQCPDVG